MVKKGILCLLLVSTAFAAGPARIIFDTDMGNDIDDAMALAVIHALESRGESRLLAVTLSKADHYGAPFVIAVQPHSTGGPDIPIGVVRNGKTPEDGNYDQGGIGDARSPTIRRCTRDDRGCGRAAETRLRCCAGCWRRKRTGR